MFRYKYFTFTDKSEAYQGYMRSISPGITYLLYLVYVRNAVRPAWPHSRMVSIRGGRLAVIVDASSERPPRQSRRAIEAWITTRAIALYSAGSRSPRGTVFRVIPQHFVQMLQTLSCYCEKRFSENKYFATIEVRNRVGFSVNENSPYFLNLAKFW